MTNRFLFIVGICALLCTCTEIKVNIVDNNVNNTNVEVEVLNGKIHELASLLTINPRDLSANAYIQSIWETDTSRYLQIISFFSEETLDPIVAEALLVEALDQDVPVFIVFGLAWAESRYRNVISRPNENGTRDYGIMQLNGQFYRNKNEVMDVRKNVNLGVAHIKRDLDRYPIVELALSAYNAGGGRVNTRTIPKTTVRHVTNITTKSVALYSKFKSFMKEIILQSS